jgi:hypothetical protein
MSHLAAAQVSEGNAPEWSRDRSRHDNRVVSPLAKVRSDRIVIVLPWLPCLENVIELFVHARST